MHGCCVIQIFGTKTHACFAMHIWFLCKWNFFLPVCKAFGKGGYFIYNIYTAKASKLQKNIYLLTYVHVLIGKT